MLDVEQMASCISSTVIKSITILSEFVAVKMFSWILVIQAMGPVSVMRNTCAVGSEVVWDVGMDRTTGKKRDRYCVTRSSTTLCGKKSWFITKATADREVTLRNG